MKVIACPVKTSDARFAGPDEVNVSCAGTRTYSAGANEGNELEDKRLGPAGLEDVS